MANLSAQDRTVIHEILSYMRTAARKSLHESHLKSFLQRLLDVPLNGLLLDLIDQFKMNEGILDEPDYGFRDLHPELSRSSKRMLILMAMEKLESGGNSVKMFQRYTRFVRVGKERFEVEQVVYCHYVFILYRILDSHQFVVDEVQNHPYLVTINRVIDFEEAKSILHNAKIQLEWNTFASLGPMDFDIALESQN